MYKVETHNNSKKYFEEIVIEEDSFYIASTTTLRAVLNKERKKLEKDVWRVIDIENFNKLIYKQWNYSINQLKIKNVIRKIIIQLKSEISDKNLIKELTYFEDNIDIFKMAFQIRNIRLHQLGLTGSTNARDNLDVRSTIQFNDSVEILCSCNCFHIVTRFQKSNIFHFLKLLRCIYYTVC